ncbi:class I SAM-dependent methyltransferase [Mediterraneibacter massiliensis]|uniref:class I SAM-dependent methyltransferase n=1 Tax=Mediterraneibacter massiliensis TaxID=1720300 RepID=UPI0024AE06D8|nr:class I SAM-dependent methyltransferase [Mediterraneibacter massiliensis]
MERSYQITEYCHHFLQEYIKEGDCCVDATAGNGGDTEFLCRCVGDTGKVFAFDIQKIALQNTEARLKKAGYAERAQLFEAGHENMSSFVKEQAAAIVFNFGYLPGGNHKIATQPHTSIEGIKQGLKILKQGGVMSLCIYSGKDTGSEEKEAILSFLKELDDKKWLVIVNSYYNRKNEPPLPVFIIRLK